jgi:hypothetical protein
LLRRQGRVQGLGTVRAVFHFRTPAAPLAHRCAGDAVPPRQFRVADAGRCLLELTPDLGVVRALE